MTSMEAKANEGRTQKRTCHLTFSLVSNGGEEEREGKGRGRKRREGEKGEGTLRWGETDMKREIKKSRQADLQTKREGGREN